MTSRTAGNGAPGSRPALPPPTLARLGVVPFFLVAIAFLFLPISFLVLGSFQDTQGSLTFENYTDLTDP
ncbi:MAG: acriflavin resistance protein, partial [Chloroflexota bacterium]